jgi:hypothetical protein
MWFERLATAKFPKGFILDIYQGMKKSKIFLKIHTGKYLNYFFR